jgi:hypothetical protein
MIPWLLIGGTLALHHPFDDEVFLSQARDEQCAVVAVPAALALRLDQCGALSRRGAIKTIVAAWRAPEHTAASAVWSDPVVGIVDVPVFGETGVFATRRGRNGRPAPLAVGPVTAPRGVPGALHVGEVSCSEAGTVALRGPQVPKFPLPSELDPVGKPAFAVRPDGFADTGVPCTVDPATRSLTISGPAVGVASRYQLAERALGDRAA